MTGEEVTVVIPNYNGKQLLKNCIRTLERQTVRDFTLLVIDNGSTDGSTELTSDVLAMEMVCLPDNRGFCGAVNIGLAKAATPYVLLLNNDTEAEETFVEEMILAIKRHADACSCSACMIDYRARALLDNAGDLYTLLGWAVARGKGREIKTYPKECRVFSACGGASIFDMRAVQAIGGFDEAHFAYLEDVDWGYRARIEGYHSYYAPRARVYHVGSATTGTRYNDKKVYLAARNSVYVIFKNMPFLQWLINLPFLCLGIAVKLAFFVKKGFAGEYARGIKDGLCGLSKLKKVPFRLKNIPHYFAIEAEMIWNIGRIVLHR